MGKIKESFSTLYYSSSEDFFSDIETGTNQPTYVGLLDIVRVLKLIKTRVQAQKRLFDQEVSMEVSHTTSSELEDLQLCFESGNLNPLSEVSSF